MMHDNQGDNGKDDGQQEKKGGSAPDPMKSDVGRTDDVPKETA